MDNALIIDLVLAAVLAVFALLGARKGLIRSLMALVSVVVALIGATLLTAMFVEPVTDIVYPRVEEKVLAQFERDIPSDALAAEDGDLSAGGLLPDELVSYYAWYQQSGTAGVDVPDVPGTVTSLSAVVAELTTARLTVRDRTRAAGDDFPDERRMFLEVFDKETQRMIVRVPLVDYALLVKGENRRDMDDQEFLDRMDEYNLVFVLDANMRWLSMDVNIHSWKLVFHNKEI